MADVIRILSIDGGGIRGIIPAALMAAIEERTGQPICRLFDLIAGTSTGGVLTLGVTMPGRKDSMMPNFLASQGQELYEKEGGRIFDLTTWKRISSFWNMSDEKYPSSGVEAVLKETFGKARLQDALTNVLITAYEIESRSPWFFRSTRAKTNPDYDFPMWQVARATSAAPTYFEPCKIDIDGTHDFYALVDGGVFANNPAMCALVEARVMYPKATRFLVVSLGTGKAQRAILYKKAKDWGLVGWVQPIIDVLMHGVSDTVDFQMKQQLPPKQGKHQYYRFNVDLMDESDDLDNASEDNIRALKRTAQKMLGEQEESLDELCVQLKKLYLQRNPQKTG